MEIHRPVADPEPQVGTKRRRHPDLLTTHRRLEPTLSRREGRVVGLEQRPLVGGVDQVTWRQRLTRQREGAAVLDPVEVHGPAVPGAKQVLQRRIGGMPGCRARQHDRGIHLSQHRSIRLARGHRAQSQHTGVPVLGKRLLQHVDDADVDTSRLHHGVTQVGNQVVEHPGGRDQQHPLARLERQLRDKPVGHRRPVERQLGLGGGQRRHGQHADESRRRDRSACHCRSSTRECSES